MLILGYDKFDVNNHPISNTDLNQTLAYKFYYIDYEIKNIYNIESKYLYCVQVFYFEFWSDEKSKHLDISEKALEDIRSGKAKLFISFVLESLTYNNDVRNLLTSWIINFKLPYNSIILSSGNYLFGDRLKYNRFVKHIYYGIWELISCIDIYQNNPLVKTCYDSIINKKRRNKIYLCYNRRPRNHRVFLINKLYRQDLLKYGYVSLDLDGNKIDLFGEDLFKMLPLNFDNTDLKINQAYSINEKDFLNSYISIVTETTCTNNQIFASEKIYKPIMAMHPFIVLSNPGFLNFLKTMKYKTFSNWIDESYDKELDLNKRINMIVEEIKKLTEMSHDQLQDMLIDMLPVLEHNLSNFKKRSLTNNFQKQLEDELWK